MKKPPSLYVQTVAHIRIYRDEGALRRARRCRDVWRKVRCGGRVRMGVGGRKFVGVGAKVCCCGGMRMGVGGRKFVGAGTKVRCGGGAGAEMCGGRRAAEGASS